MFQNQTVDRCLAEMQKIVKNKPKNMVYEYWCRIILSNPSVIRKIIRRRLALKFRPAYLSRLNFINSGKKKAEIPGCTDLGTLTLQWARLILDA